MKTIDLNADLGEGFPNDAALLGLVTSTSLSCGAHAGEPSLILATLREAMSRLVATGAHPGYADREGFGRRNQALMEREVERLIVEQVQELIALTRSVDGSCTFVKPHGALYNQAQNEPEVARGVIAAVQSLGLPVLGLPRSLLEELAGEAGVTLIAEGFPERRYGPDGRLASRTRPDAILHDPGEIAEQVLRLVEEGVKTLCIHGDDPNAVAKARTVRSTLESHGILIKPWT